MFRSYCVPLSSWFCIISLQLLFFHSTLYIRGVSLTLRKIANWMSKNYRKLDFFFNCKKLSFFSKKNNFLTFHWQFSRGPGQTCVSFEANQTQNLPNLEILSTTTLEGRPFEKLPCDIFPRDKLPCEMLPQHRIMH